MEFYLATGEPPTNIPPFDSTTTQIIVTAINNQNSHWSLLILMNMDINNNKTFCAFHADSCRPLNSDTAKRAVQLISRSICPNHMPNFHELSVDQQHNGYDCGVHVLMNLESFLSQGCKPSEMRSLTTLAVQYRQKVYQRLLDARIDDHDNSYIENE